MITLPRSVCVDLNQALSKEWLVTNGIGGYASGTLAGINTRRYHGYLIAALKPPVERIMFLSNINEEADIDGRVFYLGANEYPDGKIHPGGYVHVDEFRIRDGIPTTIFGLGDSLLHKTVWMEQGHNTTYVRYTYVEGEGECSLTLHAMCNFRDFHSTTKGALDWNFQVDSLPGGCKVWAYNGAAPMWLTSQPAADFTHTGVWYWNFVYRKEIERGFEGKEDLYLPGVMRVVLQPGESFTLVASTEPPEATTPLIANALERERARQSALLKAAGVPAEAEDGEAADPAGSESAFVAQLVRAVDAFMVVREVGAGRATKRVPTVIAGYHWFADWGRDTMISLPGLCLQTGRADEAKQTLRAFALFVRDGLLPNNFPDKDEPPEYNTVDASLWFFNAVEKLVFEAGAVDLDLARDLYPILADIINQHIKGTRYNIHMDPKDKLLYAGEEGLQLTWMDAKVDSWVVTPRIGKPVEINALWYNALRVMERLRLALQDSTKDSLQSFNDLTNPVKNSFRKRFWYQEGGYLYDVVDGPDDDDPSLRPNQLLAISLSPALLGKVQANKVLSAVRERLLTPYGLRTLPRRNPQYKGTYIGDRMARDGAYHQGTVWAWLLGPYFDAVRAVKGHEAAAREWRSILSALRVHMADAGLGSISEIFDADPPHTPRGCIAQAWSVSEVLRLARLFGSEL